MTEISKVETIETKEGFAVSKYVRLSPKRARVEAAKVRRMNTKEALDRLYLSTTKASEEIYKTVFSALSNCIYKHAVDKEKTELWELRIDQGPSLKRSKPRNKGRSAPVLKPLIHISARVRVIEDSKDN